MQQRVQHDMHVCLGEQLHLPRFGCNPARSDCSVSGMTQHGCEASANAVQGKAAVALWCRCEIELMLLNHWVLAVMTPLPRSSIWQAQTLQRSLQADSLPAP